MRYNVLQAYSTSKYVKITFCLYLQKQIALFGEMILLQLFPKFLIGAKNMMTMTGISKHWRAWQNIQYSVIASKL